MSSPTPAEFYADSHLALRYGVHDALHKSKLGHSGQDVNGWAAGTRIPAWRAGRVALRGSTTNFGNWVSVDVGGGEFDHYCHLVSLTTAPTVGTVIRVGSDCGPLGNSGYSFGNHLHGMTSRRSNPELYYQTRDPRPDMIASRSGGGFAGFQPLFEGEDMKVIQHSGVDYLVGRSYIARSPDGPTTTQWREAFGESVRVEDANDLNRLLWGLSIPNATLGALDAHAPHIAAWEPSRGVYRPADATSLDPVAVPSGAIDYERIIDGVAAKMPTKVTLPEGTLS